MCVYTQRKGSKRIYNEIITGVLWEVGLCVCVCAVQLTACGLARPDSRPDSAGCAVTRGAPTRASLEQRSLYVFPTLSFSLPIKGTVDPALCMRTEDTEVFKQNSLLVEPMDLTILMLLDLSLASDTLPSSLWRILFCLLRHHLLLLSLFLFSLFSWLHMSCSAFICEPQLRCCPWPPLFFLCLPSLSNPTYSCGPSASRWLPNMYFPPKGPHWA